MNERARSTEPIGTSVLVGLLLGAGFGVTEMAIRSADRMEPSVARRVPDLLLYTACFYGLAGLALGLVAHFAARRSQRPRAVALGVGLGGPVFVATVLYAGGELWTRPASTRLFALTGCAVASLIAAGLVARLVRESWIPRVVRATNLACLGAAAIVIAGAVALLGARGEQIEPFAGERGPATPDAPNIVFVLVDTLRADVLGTYGDPGGLSPNVDALAARGAVFEEVQAPTSWTLPSIASLFTSREPWRHGMLDFNKLLPHDLDSLPKVLGRAGYDRRAFVGNGLVNMDRGFSQGFEHFDVYTFDLESHLFLSNALTRTLRLTNLLSFAGRAMNPVPWIERSRFPWLTTRISFDADDQILTDRVLASVRDREDAPLFLYVHYGAPHSPYTEHPQGLLPSQPPLAPENRDELWRRYRAEVAWTDAELGRLLRGLETQGILDNALVVFTADHGEEFLDHGKWEHGYGLYEEVVRVPWIMAGPGATAGTRIPGRVRLVDVAPTLLAWAGLPPSEDFDGQNHAALLLSGAEAPADPPVFSELTSRFLNPEENWFSATHGRWKVIRRRDLDGELLGEELFDLEADPLERAPLEPTAAELASLHEALDVYESLQSVSADGELSEDQLRAMRAMGYLEMEPK